jgi:DNA-binding response OmpR family regulator
VTKTLLAVDDSATMRKVFEITFGGDDFSVVTAENRTSALAKLGEKPGVVLIDTSLEGDDPYALCKEIRTKNSSAVILLLSSKFSPYDAGKGRDAGADDNIDKPFDTQAALDKVRKALLAKEGGVPSAQPVAAAPAAPPPPTERAQSMPSSNATPKSADPVVAAKPAAAKPAVAETPGRTPVAAASAATATAVNGQMAGKLSELGLSQVQIDAVIALSRDIVERVVWEVVPQLAETLIKEEIARLTK